MFLALESASSREELIIHKKMMDSMSQDNTEALMYAALLGDLTVMTDFLKKYPNEVNVFPLSNVVYIYTYAVTEQKFSY